MTAQCPFCINSLPWYQEIASSIAKDGGAAELVIASVSPDAGGVRALLDSYGIKPAKIIQTTKKDLRILGTPTVYVLDRFGIVKWAHLGQMTRTEARGLLAAVATLR